MSPKPRDKRDETAKKHPASKQQDPHSVEKSVDQKGVKRDFRNAKERNRPKAASS